MSLTEDRSDQPVPVPEPGRVQVAWPDVTVVDPPDRTVLFGIAVVGVALDAALRSGVDGVGGALLFATTAIALLASGRVRNRAAAALLIAGLVFGGGLVARANEAVLVLDVLAAMLLIGAGASLAREGDPFDVTVPRAIARTLHGVAHAVLAPGFPFRGMGGPRIPGGVARGLLLALPVTLAVGALLSSADAVFASFFHIPADIGDLVLHVVLIALGAWWASALLRTASSTAFSMPVARPWTLGVSESTTVLACLAVTLGAFAASQTVAFVRGADYVERTSGLSYAEYARSGFFQLLAVGLISLATTWAVRPSLRRRSQVNLGLVVAAGNVVIAGVAIRRLFLYEDAYGLTMLRLGAVLVAVWISTVFVLTAIAIVRPGGRAWLLPAAVVTALAVLLVANVVNVEGFIVDRNVDRFAGTGKLDVDYLIGLSDDAVPTLVGRWDDLDVAERARAASGLCEDATTMSDTSSWLGWNLGAQRATDALATVCAGTGHR